MSLRAKLSRLLVGLLVVAGFAAVIMATLGAGVLGWGGRTETDKPGEQIPPSPVSVTEVTLESIEITDSYSGMIRPMERFALGFEIAGRVVELGTNEVGRDLDDGDRVRAGHVLARLDDGVLVAQRKETVAQLEKAQSDLNRAQDLKSQRVGAITETELQERVTALALAEARRDMAEKNLEDATLVSPVDAVISRRRVNEGESVNPQQTVFELIQVDEVLLVVGVPEAFVGEIRAGQPAHVEMLARDRFRKRRRRLEGKVYRVAEAADDTTGLFEVEVLLSNRERQLRPGLIGLAHIVLRRVEGFRVPSTAAVFRDGRTLLFTVDETDVAHALQLDDWIEQGSDLVLQELPPEHRTVVVRGQHRLVHGRNVVRIDEPGTGTEASPQEMTVRTTAPKT